MSAPERITAIMASQADNRLRNAMDHLLHRLRKFVETRPMRNGDQMPEHDVVWITYLEDGPERTVLDAIKANPALWAHALPDEVCIVPKEMLKRVAGTTLGVLGSVDLAETLAGYGSNMVEQHAARARYEQEEAERQREYM